jgi:hypothetical protein
MPTSALAYGTAYLASLDRLAPTLFPGYAVSAPSRSTYAQIGRTVLDIAEEGASFGMGSSALVTRSTVDAATSSHLILDASRSFASGSTGSVTFVGYSGMLWEGQLAEVIQLLTKLTELFKVLVPSLSIPYAASPLEMPMDAGRPEALAGLEEYQIENWDGEGASALSGEVIDDAASLLRSLPQYAPLPDVAPAADGTICMEFGESAKAIWIHVEPERKVAILVKQGDQREEKHFYVHTASLNRYLREQFEKLYGEQSDYAGRAAA